MRLVIDANALFATLIRKGISSEILFDNYFQFYSPELIFNEFEKYKNDIFDKSERTTVDIFRLLEIIKTRIRSVPLTELIPYLPEAEAITPDPKDVAYIALAIKLDCGVWSYDEELKQQEKIHIYSTRELLELLKNE